MKGARLASAMVATAAMLIPGAHAFWRLPCDSTLGYSRLDPIVYDGNVASHEHQIVGGNAFNSTMTYEDTQTSVCSTCKVKQDKSNYWTGTIWYVAKNGTLTPLEQIGGTLVYYLDRPDKDDPEPDSPILAFPPGFRMVAGDPKLRTYTQSLEQWAVRYTCVQAGKPTTSKLPDYPCPGNLRAEVTFPSCWDGVNLDSEDHRSHMAYPANMDSGPCPTSHPKRVMLLFFEVAYNSQKIWDEGLWWEGPNGDGHPFVLSTGDTTGYSWHGDFLNGWDPEVLQKAINECNDPNGMLEYCHAFEFWDTKTSQECKIAQMVSDPIRGPTTKLPGCNKVLAKTPASDAMTTMAEAEDTCEDMAQLTAPTLPFTDALDLGYAYLGCASDPAGQTRTLNDKSKEDETGMTVSSCINFCKEEGMTYAGLEWSKQCFCGNSVSEDRMPRTDGVWGGCNMKCSGAPDEMCGDASSISLYKACAGDSCHNAQLM